METVKLQYQEQESISDKIMNWTHNKKIPLAIQATRSPRKNNNIPQRGEIRWVEFGENIGSEMNNRHMGVVVSHGQFNRNNTATVVAITSNVQNYPTKFTLDATNYPCLKHDSAINVATIKNVATVRLDKKVGKLNNTDMDILDATLKKYLGL